MNHVTQKNRLEMRLRDYKNYVPYCPNDSLIKLLWEMNKIVLRIDQIREMNVDELMGVVQVYNETKQSKSNFKTI